MSSIYHNKDIKVQLKDMQTLNALKEGPTISSHLRYTQLYECSTNGTRIPRTIGSYWKNEFMVKKCLCSAIRQTGFPRKAKRLFEEIVASVSEHASREAKHSIFCNLGRYGLLSKEYENALRIVKLFKYLHLE